MTGTSLISKILLIVLGGFLLSFMAFYNNYPLLYPDTAAYMYAGFLDGIPNDRPKMYGLFLRHISLSDITWLVILAQGVIVSTMIYFLIKYFSPSCRYLPFHTFLISFLVLFTGVSFSVSMLIPDIFTSIFIMAFAILLLVPIKNKRDLIIISFLCWLGLIMHNSHLFIALALIIIFSLPILLRKKSWCLRQNLARCWIMVLIGILSVPSIHYLTDREFVLSKGTHIFAMNHLVEIGVVDKFLKDRCPVENYSLCDFQGKIPTDFIWDYKNSPLYLTWDKEVAWEKSRKEYNEIIREIIFTPKYLKIILYKSIIYTVKQFFSFSVSENSPQLENSHPYGAVNWFYNDESRELLLALQQRRNQLLDATAVNRSQQILFFFSIVFYVVVFFTASIRKRLSARTKQLLFFFAIVLFCNAFVCSNLSTVVPRYQNRIIWLLPAIVIICLVELTPRMKEYFAAKIFQIKK